MSEFIGLAYFAEIPATIIDVQRGGPSTGLPTKTEQSDLLTSLNPGHGDLRIPVVLEAPGAAIHAVAVDPGEGPERLVFGVEPRADGGFRIARYAEDAEGRPAPGLQAADSE